MATLTITIPDAQANRVYDAMAVRYGYNSAIHGTKAQFAKTCVINFLKNTTRDMEGNIAGKAAEATAIASVESEVILT